MKQISNELYNQIVGWNIDLWRLENNWKCGKEISKEKLFTAAKKILLNIVSENNKIGGIVMTDEQIKYNAGKYASFGKDAFQTEEEYVQLRDAYIAGAHSRDDEFALLKAEIEDDNAVIMQLKAELAKAQNPWRKVEDELPKKSKDNLLINANWVIAAREGSDGFFKAYYDHDMKVWRVLEGVNLFDIIAPDYWMPIPETPKVKED